MSSVAVKTCRPDLRGGWLCLLACGCTVHVAVERRPREIEHVCPPDPVLPEPDDAREFETRYADQEHEGDE